MLFRRIIGLRRRGVFGGKFIKRGILFDGIFSSA